MSEAATAAGIALYPSSGSSVIAGGATSTVGGAVQILTIFGVSLGLRPDFLFAGMCGAIVSIFLLNSVPLEGDGFGARISNMFQRFFVVISSAVTAGYLTPMAAPFLPKEVEGSLAAAFVVGVSARILLQKLIMRYSDAIHKSPSAQNTNRATGSEGA